MRRIFSFWWKCCRRAAAGASDFANSWAWLVGAPTLAGIVYLLNKKFGEGAVTLSQDVSGALLAAAAAFVLTWGVRFLVGLIKAPADINLEQERRITKLNKGVQQLLAAEEAIQKLSDFYHQGRKLYGDEDPFEAWKLKTLAWQDEVEKFIAANFSVAELHEFRKPGSGFEMKTDWSWEGIERKDAWHAKASVSARLSALDDMVRSSSYGFIPHKMQLRDLLEQHIE